MDKDHTVEAEEGEVKAITKPDKQRGASGTRSAKLISLLKQYRGDRAADNARIVMAETSSAEDPTGVGNLVGEEWEEAREEGGELSELNDWITPQVTRYEPEKAPAEEFAVSSEAPGEAPSNGQGEVPSTFRVHRDRIGSSRSRLEEIIKPNGHWNKRLIFGTLGALLVFLMFSVGGGNKNQKETESKAQPAKTLKDPRERSESVMQFSGAEEQTLGTPGAPAYPSGNASDVGTPIMKSPQEPPPAPLQPAPLAATPATPPKTEPAGEREPERVDEEFAVVLRAGEKAERDERAAEKEIERQKASQKSPAGANPTVVTATVKDAGVVPRTRIELSLNEPLRSGIATSVEARVLTDVRDAQGKVVIPAGSTAVLPFLAYEVNGRMISNGSESALFITPAGQQINLRGTVKGPDGFVGLTGKVKKIGGRSTAGRILSGIARAGTRTAADAVGDVSSEAENEINRASYDYRHPQFERSSRIVEVPSGTRFLFVVGR